MDQLFLKLLNMSFSASWLVLAVILLRQVLKKAPKSFRCILWGLVALRLVWPFSFESMLSLLPSAQPLPQEILMSPYPTIDSGVPVINEVVNPVLAQNSVPTAGASINPLQIWTWLAGWVWAAGMVLMALYTLISYLRLKGRVAASAWHRGNIWLCDYIDTPFILGVIRPRIYLPSAMEEEQASQVIAHENAHILRRDHWWKPLGFGLLTLHWFNPLMWIAYVLLCRDIELACDERVVKNMDAEAKKAYSRALLCCSVPRRLIAACPLAFGEVGVKERVRSVLNYKKPAFWLLASAVVACIVAAVCFLTDPVGYDPQIRYNGVIWEQSGLKTDALPENSMQIGILQGIVHRTHDLPEANFHAVNLEAKYAGCPLWTGGDKLYLQDYGGGYLPFAAAETLLMGHIYQLETSYYAHPDYRNITQQSLLFAFTDDQQLMMQHNGGQWLTLGAMEPFDLTGSNFDDLLWTGNPDYGLLTQKGRAADFRREIGQGWRLVYGDRFYYIMEHEDISLVYLVCGYYDSEGEADPYSDDSSILWVCQTYPVVQYRAGKALSAADAGDIPADGSHLGLISHVMDTLFINGEKYPSGDHAFYQSTHELAALLQAEGRYWASDAEIPHFADADGERVNVYCFPDDETPLYWVYQFPDGTHWLAEGDHTAVYLLQPLGTGIHDASALPDQVLNTALLQKKDPHFSFHWQGLDYRLSNTVLETLPEGYTLSGTLENQPGEDHALAGCRFYTSTNTPGVAYVLTERGYGAWVARDATDAAAFHTEAQKAVLSRFDVKDVEVLHCIPAEDGADGLLGIVQYRKPDSAQIFISFVTEKGCHTIWLPEDWRAEEGTALGYLGGNTVGYTTARQTAVPTVQWTFTYGEEAGQPRIRAGWTAVQEPFSSALLFLNPLLTGRGAYVFLYDQYDDYSWNVLQVEQYSIPPTDGSDLHQWEVCTTGVLVWLEGEGFPTAEALRSFAFTGIYRVEPDGTLTMTAFDDTLSPDSLPAELWAQEGMTYEEAMLELCRNVYYDGMLVNGLLVDTSDKIAGLFDRLKADPGDTSIRQELLYCGNHTLRYVFRQFLDGTAGQDRQLLWDVAVEVMGGSPIEGDFAGPQAAFDAWKQQAMAKYEAGELYLNDLRDALPEDITAGLATNFAFH